MKNWILINMIHPLNVKDNSEKKLLFIQINFVDIPIISQTHFKQISKKCDYI